MTTKMMSAGGKFYEKCRKIHPSTKAERQKMYASCDRVQKIVRGSGEKKFSPFNTVSREARDSFLLRVTNEPNTQTNYEVNHSPVAKRHRIATIDQAAFKRMIGPVNQNDYSSQPRIKSSRCSAALSSSNMPQPLTLRDLHKWKSTHEHLDFSKQLNPERQELLKELKSTIDTNLLHNLKNTTQSNFNNYKRFSLAPRSEKSHDFRSDSGHKYLQTIYRRQIQPEYDIRNANEEIIKKSMRRPKGELRFHLFKDEIKTRVDRSDPHWLQTLDYGSHPEKANLLQKKSTIDFDLMENRAENQVYSKYPIRQSLRVEVPNNRVH